MASANITLTYYTNMKIFQVIIFSFFFQTIGVQSVIGQSTLNPTIMVIPFAKEGQQLRTVYEKDEMLNLRVAVTKAKEAFDKEGIQTIDFRAKIKQVKMDDNVMAGNQSSIKQRVIELSGADVYVEIEAAVTEDPDGSSVTVRANAYDAFSGQTLASEVATTKKYYTFNFERLSQKAISFFIKDFTKNIQKKFNATIKEGRVIVVNIGFDENAEIDFDEEMEDGSLLADLVEDWIEKNSFNSLYHLQGVTSTKMIFDEVRIPVKEESGRNFRVTKFAAKLRSFLKSQGLDVTRDVVGTKVYITIN